MKHTALGLAIVVSVACVWLILGRGEDLLVKTQELERGLLDGGNHGRAAKRAVDEIIRNVDRLSRDEVRSLQKALEQDWLRRREQDVRAYFDAPPAERRFLLDRGIDRTLAYRELRFALDPHNWSSDGRPQQPRSARKGATSAAGDAPPMRQLQERYVDALRKRARERKIDLPEWQ